VQLCLLYRGQFYLTTTFATNQPWHRDVDKNRKDLTIRTSVDPFSFRINLYLKDEIGFQVIPKNVDYFNNNRNNDKEIWKDVDDLSDAPAVEYCRCDLDFSTTVSAKAGDILLMHPELFHRGYCSQDRAHIHMMTYQKTYFANLDPVPNMIASNINYLEPEFYETYFRSPSYRRVINYIKYLLPIPSRNFVKYLANKPFYVRNRFIQRENMFQKKF
jgi:hypothetical protein